MDGEDGADGDAGDVAEELSVHAKAWGVTMTLSSLRMGYAGRWLFFEDVEPGAGNAAGAISARSSTIGPRATLMR